MVWGRDPATTRRRDQPPGCGASRAMMLRRIIQSFPNYTWFCWIPAVH
jgi:hypothetical protein